MCKRKYAYLFPGQGAQQVGMLKDIAMKYPSVMNTLEDLSFASGIDIKNMLWELDDATLARSDTSQIAITAVSLALVRALQKEKGIQPNAVMGFSLGEFSALCTASVLRFEDTIRVVRRRGEIMQRVCDEIAAANEGHAPGMTAVIGLPLEKVQEIVDSVPDAYCANMNSVVQTVVSGTDAALKEVERLATEAGARRAIRLKVAGPYHCPLMHEAAVEFQSVIRDIDFFDPKIRLFSNVTGDAVTSGEEIKRNCVLHLTQGVKWTSEEDKLASFMDDVYDWTIFEVGPGKVLAGLWAKTPYAETRKVVSINTVEDFDAIPDNN